MVENFEVGTHLAAIITPFLSNYQIDEAGLRKLLKYVSTRNKITGVVFNAHAAEVDSLTYEERRRILEIGVEELKSRDRRAVACISPYPDSNQGAIRAAKDAQDLGADALLILPPRWFTWGIDKAPEVVQRYVSDIAESVNIPIFFFVTGSYTGITYTTQMIVKIFDIENVIGIKDTTWTTSTFEENLRVLHTLPRRALVLTGNDTLVFYNFLAGADGTLLILNILFPELISDMYDAVSSGRLSEAKEMHLKQEEITRVLFEPPMMKFVSKMKEALSELGRIDSPTVRPPLPVLSSQEKNKIRTVLKTCELFG